MLELRNVWYSAELHISFSWCSKGMCIRFRHIFGSITVDKIEPPKQGHAVGQVYGATVSREEGHPVGFVASTSVLKGVQMNETQFLLHSIDRLIGSNSSLMCACIRSYTARSKQFTSCITV